MAISFSVNFEKLNIPPTQEQRDEFMTLDVSDMSYPSHCHDVADVLGDDQ